MPRRFFHKLGRHREHLSRRWFLRPFRALLADPALWASHRRSVVRAVALGLFIGCMPLPAHMALAGAAAIYLRINLVVSVLATWISNPLTVTPLLLAEYYLGAWLLGITPGPFRPELSIDWLMSSLGEIWQPLLAGALLLGGVLALTAYVLLDQAWRISLSYRYRTRRRGQDKSVRIQG